MTITARKKSSTRGRNPARVSRISVEGVPGYAQATRRPGKACVKAASSAMPDGRGAENVINGIHRGVGTQANRWSSDPHAGLPQWLRVDFPAAQKIREVHLVFDTGLNRQLTLTHSESAHAPQVWGPQPETVKDYELQVLHGGSAETVAKVEDNYQRKRIHCFDTREATGLRLLIHGGRNVKPTWNGWQTNDESADAYVALLTESGERLTPNGISETGGMISFGAPSGGLKAGDRITAEFRNAAVPTLSYPEKFFVLLSAPSDAEVAPPYMLLEAADQIVGACTLAIIGGEPAAIRVHAPSHTSPGEEISLLTAMNGNPTSSPSARTRSASIWLRSRPVSPIATTFGWPANASIRSQSPSAISAP